MVYELLYLIRLAEILTRSANAGRKSSPCLRIGLVPSARWIPLRILLVVAVFVLRPTSALAHKLYVFAQVQGTTIQGRAYFPGDVPAQDSYVIARDPSGKELARTTTDANGHFSFAVRQRVDHNLSAETVDGHEGHFTVHVGELPDSLPGDSPNATADPQAGFPEARHPNKPTENATQDAQSSTVHEQITEVMRQVGALRQQILESDERLRFRDILGGIGFILGVTGVAYYMKARKKT
jgi:nickel transport protein